MRWILGLVGALLGGLAGEEEGLFLGLGLGLLIGWVIERERKRSSYLEQPKHETGFEQRVSARLVELSERVARLEREVSALRAARGPVPGGDAPFVGPETEASPAVESGETPPAAAFEGTPAERPRDERGIPLEPAPAAMRELPSTPPQAVPAAPQPSAQVPSPAIEAVRELLFGGNTVVRIGVIVLTVGLGLLAKYAAEHSYFPLELRLAFAAAVGLGLLVLGYRLHAARPAFGTALQGGGIGALYLVTFFSFSRYELLPAALAFPLLVAIAALSSVLAVLQNAQQLAVFGALGGFLAPILASRGGGSHVALFSYYALLNSAVLAIALFRSWRVLNWTAFIFTFGIASAWGALRYEAAHRVSSASFLALFFLQFLLDGTLFALRQPDHKRGSIDTTLTFGTPLATIALAAGLLQDEPLYLALACALMSAVYLAFAGVLIARREEALRALSQAYVALGVGVATLAVPFALEDALSTALAWSAEAAGLVWVGAKQQRLRTRLAGYALFAGALFALLARIGDASPGGRALFAALIAVAFAFAAGTLERTQESLRAFERHVPRMSFAVGLLAWLAALHMTATPPLVPLPYVDLTLLSLIAASIVAFEWIGERLAFDLLRGSARGAFPYLLLNTPGVLAGPRHPFASFAFIGWALAFAAGYWVLGRPYAPLSERPTLRDGVHASAAWVIAFVCFSEAHFGSRDELGLSEGWVDGLRLGAPLVVVALALMARRGPVVERRAAYLRWAAFPLSLGLSLLALLHQGASAASAAPLPYLPLLNPLDLAHLAILLSLFALVQREELRSPRGLAFTRWSTALSGFVLLNATLVRTAHHWGDVPYAPWHVPGEPLVQASFSILWTAIALIAMVLAHRMLARTVWLSGAALLAGVVLKLFLLDLASLSAVAKIITFLAVGVLLLAVGYFAPVPPLSARVEQKEKAA